MKVTVAKSSGFCFGVKTAVAAAQEAVLNPPSGKPLVMLGDIVHNTMVVESLKKGGFTVVENASDVPEGAFVLIRAHGITPSEMDILRSRGCEVKDCTCPFVSKIHKIVRENALEGRNIIVTGGKGHPEVVGICGETYGTNVSCAVISSPEELETLEFPLSSAILV